MLICVSMQSRIAIIILAAGQGKRMQQPDLPKVLVPVAGQPMIRYVLKAVAESQLCSRPTLVVGQHAELVQAELGVEYQYVLQAERLGTGHAVRCCRETLIGQADHVIVLYGDMPLVTTATIQSLIATHLDSQAVLSMATVIVPDFLDWRVGFYDFGRIVRDASGRVTGILEKKDATPEQLLISEVNPACYCFKTDWLWSALDRLTTSNTQGEYYLTDLVHFAVADGLPLATTSIEPEQALGINTLEQLASVERLLVDISKK